MFHLPLIIIIILSSPSSSSSLNLSSPITSSSSSSPSSSFLNLTKILHPSQSHTFYKAASEFQSYGIDREIDTRYPTTIFVPDDKAFEDASLFKRYKSLSEDNKFFVLNYHILSEYLPRDVLTETAGNWSLHSTIATGVMGQGKYMLNITAMVNGSVSIGNNIVRAIVTEPLYDRSPVAVYAVSKLLMPRELPHPTPTSSDASCATAAFSFVFFFVLVI
ncbi:hypothetical protein P8452_12929 [Trifolium repens]|jgi:uncharacterized surface protein with fasciclin (FAS1) repeats|nr:hypothetical protein P8452_12929 [Trifolium repens]